MMINSCRSYSRASWQRMLLKSCLIGIFAAASGLSGLVPKLSNQFPMLAFNSSVYAQEFSMDELMDYVRAARGIETLRQTVLKTIEERSGDPVPSNLACYKPNSLDGLSENIRKLVDAFCTDSRTIIEDTNLTVPRFNEIRRKYQTDPEFKKQIDNLYLNLDTKTSSNT